MTDSSDKFFAQATYENAAAIQRGARAITEALANIQVSLRYKRPAVDRITLLRNIQDGVGLIIAADGRQTLVEDANKQPPAVFAVASPPVPPKTRRSLTEDLWRAAVELTKYTEDEDEDTDDQDDRDDEDEDSDDPVPCARLAPVSFGIFLKDLHGRGPRSSAFPLTYPTRGDAEFAVRYANPVGPGGVLTRDRYEVLAL